MKYHRRRRLYGPGQRLASANLLHRSSQQLRQLQRIFRSRLPQFVSEEKLMLICQEYVARRGFLRFNWIHNQKRDQFHKANRSKFDPPGQNVTQRRNIVNICSCHSAGLSARPEFPLAFPGAGRRGGRRAPRLIYSKKISPFFCDAPIWSSSQTVGNLKIRVKRERRILSTLLEAFRKRCCQC
ncbi:hypothetical protein EVAR_36817_1 [Eumeta japonica]|uniref:Uncharacterized protein n=1 Tax=Eumeta variegata TaxID=151549 RepID=A0A4C1WWE4_EUMVA|nr:hypothetical protein EVAR_36817_1 [Eumeta japonica]